MEKNKNMKPQATKKIKKPPFFSPIFSNFRSFGPFLAPKEETRKQVTKATATTTTKHPLSPSVVNL